LSNIEIYISNDVTGCLIFGRDIEVFCDYDEEEKEDQKIFWRDKDDLILSKGASEKRTPLPVISALAQNFIQAYNEFPEIFEEEENPDKTIVPLIFKATIGDLKLDKGHTNEEVWTHPKPITTKDYLFRNGLNDCIPMEFPLTFEIINLILYAVLHHKGAGTRSVNSNLRELQREYLDYLYYLSQEMNNPTYLLSERIKELTFRPVSIATEDMPKDEPAKYSFAIDSKAGILSLAWAELYFAKMFEMPISICTYCGEVFTITRNLSKSTCDKLSCKKQLRKDRDQRKREEDPEGEKEKDRIRQQRLRDKNKAKRLFSKGKSIQEIRKILNDRIRKRGINTELRTIDDIKNWVKE